MDEAIKTPTRAKKLRRLSDIAEGIEKVSEKPITLPQKLSNSDALAHILENNLTKSSYINMRLISKNNYADIWPTYNNICEEKKICRPENIQYTETSVVVSILDRLRHNDTRFLKLYDNEIKVLLQDIPDNGTIKLEAESKVGFDGSSGHSIYNQAFSLQNKDKSEASLLATCLVPLQYRTENGYPIFTNPVPQSSSFCQPIRLEFLKETPEMSLYLDNWIEDQIRQISPNIIEIELENPPGKKMVEIHHILKKTMLDGKAKNAVTETASPQTCFLCKANPKKCNILENFPSIFPTIKDNLQYGGVCDLHAWIRAFEAINKLSDKLTIKKWRRSKNDKKEIEKRKKIRQARFKEELGLIVDVPRSGGAGSSNTGNVARRAFQSEEKFASITEVDINLIHRIHIMLITINLDRTINVEAFRAYGFDTAALWVSLYNWYYMPVSLHQLLFHAWESIKTSILPISLYTEQSLESCNKSFKHDRLHHSRKDTRIHTIMDQFNRQNDKSDLLIAMKLQNRRYRKRPKEIPEDALSLILEENSIQEDSDGDVNNNDI